MNILEKKSDKFINKMKEKNVIWKVVEKLNKLGDKCVKEMKIEISEDLRKKSNEFINEMK